MDPRFGFLLFLLAFVLGGVLCVLAARALVGQREQDSGEMVSFLALFWTPLFLAALLLWGAP